MKKSRAENELKISDMLIVMNGKVLIPDPDRTKEVKKLYREGYLERDQVKDYLAAGFN